MLSLSRSFKTAIMFVAIAVFISACGGDGNQASTEISGVVSDGPIQNARVFLDLNLNSEYDEGEPYSMTDASGAYSIKCNADLCAEGTKSFIVAEGSEELGTVDNTDNAGSVLEFVMFVGTSVSSVGKDVEEQNINPSSFISFLKEIESDYSAADLSAYSGLMNTEETDATVIFQNFINNKKDEFQGAYSNISSEVSENFGNPDFTVTHKAVNVKIIHINDPHSHLEEEDIDIEISDGFEVTAPMGGFARVATKIKELEAEASDTSILLHAGDAISGTLYYTLYKGAADAALTNLVDFDAMAVGNHEFDDGDQNLADFIDLLEFPVISANVIPADGNVLEDKIRPYVIKKINGEKIGIIGLTIKDKTQNSSSPSDDITFLEEKDAVEDTVEILTNLGINKIILLSHYGHNYTTALAAEVDGVDVIVDGDSHTLLGDFSDIGLTASGDYPTEVTSPAGDKVCVVQAYQYSYVVGELNVSFDADGKVTSCSGTPVMLLGDIEDFTTEVNDEDVALSAEQQSTVQTFIEGISTVEVVAENSEAKTTLETYSTQVEELKATTIGHSGEALTHERIPGQAYFGTAMPLGSDIAPIVAKGFLLQDPNADVCIQNGGGVRISIDDDSDITYDTAYTLLPFSNTLYELEMTGAEIKSVLEDAVDYSVFGSSTGAFPYAYGLKYDVDATQDKGSRIQNLEVKNKTTGEWSNISTDTMYTVITNNYIAGGKDGYTTFKTVMDARGGVDTYLDYAMSFVNYVKQETAAGRNITKLPAEDHCIKSYTAPVQQ